VISKQLSAVSDQLSARPILSLNYLTVFSSLPFTHYALRITHHYSWLPTLDTGHWTGFLLRITYHASLFSAHRR